MILFIILKQSILTKCPIFPHFYVFILYILSNTFIFLYIFSILVLLYPSEVENDQLLVCFYKLFPFVPKLFRRCSL